MKPLRHPDCSSYLDVVKISQPNAPDFSNLTRSSLRYHTLLAGAAEHLTGEQSRQDFVKWLSPPDPSINYNIARETHHKATAVWFTESNTFRDWKKSGSLLWIHGKRTSFRTLHLLSL